MDDVMTVPAVTAVGDVPYRALHPDPDNRADVDDEIVTRGLAVEDSTVVLRVV